MQHKTLPESRLYPVFKTSHYPFYDVVFTRYVYFRDIYLTFVGCFSLTPLTTT
jgi:hypothetical protein